MPVWSDFGGDALMLSWIGMQLYNLLMVDHGPTMDTSS